MERRKQNTVASNAEQQYILFEALDGFDHDYQASAHFPLTSAIKKSPPNIASFAGIVKVALAS